MRTMTASVVVAVVLGGFTVAACQLPAPDNRRRIAGYSGRMGD